MNIVYIIGGCRPEYEGWLRIGEVSAKLSRPLRPNNDELRKIIIRVVNRYMHPAGQKYHLYWVELNNQPINDFYHQLTNSGIPRLAKSAWFNTDVWTVRQILKHSTQSVQNYRRLKPTRLARYLNYKYQLELTGILKHPHNSKEQRFKRDFFSTWRLSSADSQSIQRTVKIFSIYLPLRNLVSTVPKGCRKMFRKLVPLRMDNLDYDLKLLDYKSGLTKIIRIRNQINSLSGKPFGTAEFTNQYLIKHVKFLQNFDSKFLKQTFNL